MSRLKKKVEVNKENVLSDEQIKSMGEVDELVPPAPLNEAKKVVDVKERYSRVTIATETQPAIQDNITGDTMDTIEIMRRLLNKLEEFE